MKWLAGMLLVLNLLFFGWGFLGADKNVAKDAVPPSIGNLKLISEMESELHAKQEKLRLQKENKIAEEKEKARIAREKLIAEEKKREEEKKLEEEKLAAEEASRIAKAEALALESEKLAEKQRQQRASQSQQVLTEFIATEPEQSENAADTTEFVTPDSWNKNCRTMGPFNTLEQANNIAVVLARGDVAATPRKTVLVNREGYWVIVPAKSTLELGKETLTKLDAAGIEDTWLFRKGTMKGAISLGLFSKEKNAKRRAESVRKKGFFVVVQPKSSETEQVWLDFTQPRKKLPAGFIDELRKNYKGFEYKQRACPK